MSEFLLRSPVDVQLNYDRFAFDASEEGRGFLFDRRTGDVFSLNATGAFIVHSILQGTPLPEIPSKLSKAFRVPHEEACRDVAEFLSELRELGLLS